MSYAAGHAPYRWGTLAQYNSERARGILHTTEWQNQMAREQELFDAETRAHVAAHGVEIVDSVKEES